MTGWRQNYLLFSGAVLLAPAIAMTVTQQVDWGIEDFAAAGSLLIMTWIALEGVLQFCRGTAVRITLSGLVVAAALMTWALPAVGY